MTDSVATLSYTDVVMGSMADVLAPFVSRFFYDPHRLLKAITPTDDTLLQQVSTTILPPLLPEQRSAAKRRLADRIRDPLFLTFLRAILQRAFTTRPRLANGKWSAASFRQRYEASRSFFEPLPSWTPLSSSGVRVLGLSCCDIPVLMTIGDVGLTMHLYVVGSLLNQIIYRCPFFAWTLTYANIESSTPHRQQQRKQTKQLATQQTVGICLQSAGTNDVLQNPNEYTVTRYLQEGRLTPADVLSLTLQICFGLLSAQQQFGWMHRNLTADRVLVRSLEKSIAIEMDTFGQTWSMTIPRVVASMIGWTDATLRQHPHSAPSLDAMYVGPVRKAGFNASLDLYTWLSSVRQVCVGLRTKGSVVGEHAQAILTMIESIYAQFFEFTLSSPYWLEQSSQHLSIYSSRGYARTPYSFIVFCNDYRSSLRDAFDVRPFLLTVKTRELWNSENAGEGVGGLPVQFRDFVRDPATFENTFRKTYEGYSRVDSRDKDALQEEAKRLVNLLPKGILQDLVVRPLTNYDGVRLPNTWTMYNDNYLVAQGSRVEGTLQFWTGLCRLMDEVLFLRQFDYTNYLKTVQGHEKTFETLQDAYTRTDKCRTFEEMCNVLMTLRSWPLDRHLSQQVRSEVVLTVKEPKDIDLQSQSVLTLDSDIQQKKKRQATVSQNALLPPTQILVSQQARRKQQQQKAQQTRKAQQKTAAPAVVPPVQTTNAAAQYAVGGGGMPDTPATYAQAPVGAQGVYAQPPGAIGFAGQGGVSGQTIGNNSAAGYSQMAPNYYGEAPVGYAQEAYAPPTTVAYAPYSGPTDEFTNADNAYAAPFPVSSLQRTQQKRLNG